MDVLNTIKNVLADVWNVRLLSEGLWRGAQLL